MPRLFAHTLCHHLWQEFRTRWHFKHTLPRLHEVTLAGVRLDVSALSPIMKNQLLQGRYEVQERALAEACLTADDTVLELGGAIGFIGLFCQRRLGIRRYTTVEANPDTIELLRRNYALNGLEPVVWNVAVAERDADVTLRVGREFWENSLVAGAAADRVVQVPGLTLASLCQLLPYAPSALIVDVEGAEQWINFRELPASVRKVLIELHPALIGPARAYQVVADLLNLGFRVERENAGTWLFLRA